MSFTTLSAIVRGNWLIQRSYVLQHLPLIAGVLTGKGNGAELFSGSAGMEKPFVVKDGKKIPAYSYAWNGQLAQYEEILNESLFADGSTAVIPVIGPVMKYNGDCGEPGMVNRSGWLYDLANSSKVTKMAFWMDTPGGQCDGTPQFANLISDIDKPTFAFVAGGAYSAGAWIASACDEIILADKYAGIGSVGVYQTYMDFSKYLKKLGVDITDIYAKQSTEKNLAYRQAEEGDFSLIEEGVTQIAANFIEAFDTNRNGKLKNDSWNKGGTFTGQQAIELGMADRIASFNDAIATKGKTSVAVSGTKNTQITKQDNMKFPKTFALAGKETVSQAELDVANAELTEAGITGVALFPEALVNEAAGVTELNTTLTATNNTLTATNTKLTNDLAAANTSLTSLNAEVIVLKDKIAKGPAAAAPAVGGADPVTEQTPEQINQATIAALPHNQGIMGNPLFTK